jgi:hypothetical protein
MHAKSDMIVERKRVAVCCVVSAENVGVLIVIVAVYSLLAKSDD